MKHIWLIFVAMSLFSISLPGCTTATYGIKPTPVAEQQDTFTFKIYTGGFAAGATADKRAAKEFDRFMVSNGYSSYTILNKQYDLFPSGFVYTVKFSR
jgi:hypothetical protein